MSFIGKIAGILFWSVILWILVRTFICQSFRIPSASMYGGLIEGDFVVINKMAYGTRLPFTPLSLKVAGHKKSLDWIQLPYLRLFGYAHICRNDVIAFNYAVSGDEPIDMQEEYIKRCVALPGDTLEIREGRVYVNALSNNIENVYQEYNIVSDREIDSAAVRRQNILPAFIAEGKKKYAVFMNKRQADSLAGLDYVRSVVVHLFPRDYYPPSVYPNHSAFKWNDDFFGPLWIPKKGDSVVLTAKTLVLYQKLIEKYEKTTVLLKGDSVYVNGKAEKYYCFKQDYYFMLGDNRHNSTDSRSWGPVPADHLIGKATYILYSAEKSGRRLQPIR